MIVGAALGVLAVASGLLVHRRRSRPPRLDPCDAIEWHAAKRRGEIK